MPEDDQVTHTSPSALPERRRSERRSHPHAEIHWPERRTGFDRRASERTVSDHQLQRFAKNRLLLLGLIVLIGTLSALDLAMTARELALGASEANPVMRAAFGDSIWSAAAIKTVSFLVVSTAIWFLRRYRTILQLAVITTILYGGILIYHMIGLASLLQKT